MGTQHIVGLDDCPRGASVDCIHAVHATQWIERVFRLMTTMGSLAKMHDPRRQRRGVACVSDHPSSVPCGPGCLCSASPRAVAVTTIPAEIPPTHRLIP